jgi:hypothetical protein
MVHTYYKVQQFHYTCSNMNIVQTQTLILTNETMACCKLNLAYLIMVLHIELSYVFPTVTPH